MSLPRTQTRMQQNSIDLRRAVRTLNDWRKRDALCSTEGSREQIRLAAMEAERLATCLRADAMELLDALYGLSLHAKQEATR